MSVKLNTIRLHIAIKNEYQKLTDIKEFGVSKYSNEYILRKVADKFFRSPKTIENIVFNRTNIQYETSQLNIFNQDSIM